MRRFRLPPLTASWAALLSGRRGRARVALPVVVVLVVGAIVPLTLIAARPTVTLSGLPSDGKVSRSELRSLRVRVAADGADPGTVRVNVDGHPIRGQRPGAGVVALDHLEEGRHELTVEARSFFGLARVSTSRRFTVDTTPPELTVPEEAWAESFKEPFNLRGDAPGAATVMVGGEPVSTTGEGTFKVRVKSPPATVELTAADAAGNTAKATVSVGVEHPGMRAVHMTAVSWTSDALRKPILEMARQGKIDTVELDIKDESGHVGYDSKVKLANKIGASKGYYNVKKVIEKLHSMGVRVVGRLVCFLDPVLAEAAWRSGHKDRVIQTPSGGPYSGGYGDYTFTNFANPVVREYNLDLAVEAAKLGFDGILYDYIRRPDGFRDNMRFPGLDTSPSRSVASFVRESAKAIHAEGAFVGVSVFGIAATRPKQTAQDIPLMAKYADYVAPMVYPSHWGPGEYGVANPNSQPYPIVKRSLKDFKRQVEGTGAVVIPWLQDFSLGVSYGPDEVRAQIDAAHDVGIDSFLLWNAGASYTQSALESSD